MDFPLSDNLLSEVTIHPLIIHFPIVLFFVFIVFYSLTIFIPQLISRSLNLGILITLVVFCLLSKYTGENAGIVVAPTLTNPKALTIHASYALNYIWSVVALFSFFILVEYFVPLISKRRDHLIKFFKFSVLGVGLVCSFWLIRTGHTGATLVYKYAAGVDIPIARAQKLVNESQLKSK